MQTLADLKQKLEPSLHNQVDGWYQTFVEETGRAEVNLFLAYITRKGLLPNTDLSHLRTDTPVDVTEMETLAASFQEVIAVSEEDEALQPTLTAHSFRADANFADEDTIPPEQVRPSHVNLPELPRKKRASGQARAGQAYSDTIDLATVDNDHIIIESIGKGAMGVVYLARDTLLGRKVAFKQVRPDRKDDQEAISRFLREAQITAQLDHPAVAPVYRLVKGFEDLPAYTMKIIEGQTLEQVMQEAKDFYLRGEPVPESHSLGTRLEQFLKVCDAISYAHNKGVLHRDLKPKNIMVGRFGVVYVVDWGLARLMYEGKDDEEDSIKIQNAHGFQSIRTEAGQMMGTPQYMSPEQAQGRINVMDGRSDLYSLGIILYELVFLRPAIEGSTLLELVQRILSGDLNEMEHISPNEYVDAELKAIIARATAHQLEDRYASVEEMADEIRLYMRGETIIKHPERKPPPDKQTEPRERSYLSPILALLLVCALGFSAWYVSIHQQRSKQQNQQQQSLLQRTDASHRLAQALEQRLTLFARLVQGLASATSVALQRAPAITAPESHLHKDFLPADMSKSTFYRDTVSLLWPVIKLPPHSPRPEPKKRRRRRRKRSKTKQSSLPKTYAQRFHQLSGLQQHLRQTLFESLPEAQQRLSLQEKTKLLMSSGFPVLSTFIATHDGLIALYPGQKAFSPEYDPRQQTWFQEARKHKRTHWGQPHVSEQSVRAAQITCTLPVFQTQGEKDKEKETLLAVVGANLSLNALTEEMKQANATRPWVTGTLLLDQQGAILLQTGVKYPRHKGKTVLPRKLFPLEPVREQIKRKTPSGHLVVEVGKNKRQLIIYRRLQTTPWYHVTLSDWE